MRRFLKGLLYLLPLIPAIGIVVLIVTHNGNTAFDEEGKPYEETTEEDALMADNGIMDMEAPLEELVSTPVMASAKNWETGMEEKAEQKETEVSAFDDGSDDGEMPTPAGEYLLCIDPGHYGGANPVTGRLSYGYAEGDVTLKLALALQRILWEEYGIDSYLTRETEHITIGGLTDKALDKGRIALRGACASLYQCDLFISLHTNANAKNANGYPTFEQPASINKPMIIVNEVALSSKTALSCALHIGENLAEVYRMHDLCGSEFIEDTGEKPAEWTGRYNDGLNQPGMVVYRMGKPREGSDDYYGVLRGSANEGISGMIIEHGFHSVPEIRRLAMEENLIDEWAKADADGIARGLGVEGEQYQDR